MTLLFADVVARYNAEKNQEILEALQNVYKKIELIYDKKEYLDNYFTNVYRQAYKPYSCAVVCTDKAENKHSKA